MNYTPDQPAPGPDPLMDVLGDLWQFNPRWVVTDGEKEMVRLWAMGGGLDGVSHLPEAGGLLDQAAVMVDAFAIITSAAAAWRDLKKGSE